MVMLVYQRVSIGYHMDTMDQWNIMEYHGIWNSIDFTPWGEGFFPCCHDSALSTSFFWSWSCVQLMVSPRYMSPENHPNPWKNKGWNPRCWNHSRGALQAASPGPKRSFWKITPDVWWKKALTYMKNHWKTHQKWRKASKSWSTFGVWGIHSEYLSISWRISRCSTSGVFVQPSHGSFHGDPTKPYPNRIGWLQTNPCEQCSRQAFIPWNTGWLRMGLW